VTAFLSKLSAPPANSNGTSAGTGTGTGGEDGGRDGGRFVSKSMDLEPMDRRQKWLVYDFVGRGSAPIQVCSGERGTPKGPPTVLQVKTIPGNPEELRQHQVELRREREQREAEALRRAVGFRRVVDTLSRSSKPVIVYNGLLDLLHTHSKLIGSLPGDQASAGEALHKLFPLVFDSKHLLEEAKKRGLELSRMGLGSILPQLRTKADEVAAATATTPPLAGTAMAPTDGGLGEGPGVGAVKSNGNLLGKNGTHNPPLAETGAEAIASAGLPGAVGGVG
ncbi:unnamed protein product, partial [Discosporangium mesarthrocarpum]